MKIICIGRNYAAHAAELNNNIPTTPVMFMKPQTALLKNDNDFYYPSFTEDIHYECEVVLRVSKSGKHIEPQFAYKYIDAYTLGIDFTARDIQDQQKQAGLPWEIAKAFDNSAVIGNVWKELNKENFNTPIQFVFKQNEEVMQQGNTSDMLFDFSKIISVASSYFTLQQGDLIFTGTPQGVGAIGIGDKLQGFLGDELIFTTLVK
jgi:acylpyruvate hydrolase